MKMRYRRKERKELSREQTREKGSKKKKYFRARVWKKGEHQSPDDPSGTKREGETQATHSAGLRRKSASAPERNEPDRRSAMA